MDLPRIQRLQSTAMPAGLPPVQTAFNIGKVITSLAGNTNVLFKARRPFWDLNPLAPPAPMPTQR